MARRIAMIEDDRAIRENYADVLRRQGYEVAAFANRADALKAMRIRLPDLALIDIGLADEIEGGFALCRELRAMTSMRRNSAAMRASRCGRLMSLVR